MFTDLDQAIAALRAATQKKQHHLERLSETALSIGDQALAEIFADRAADIALAIPHLDKLSLLPEDNEQLPPPSKTPSRDERGVGVIYACALEMLADARADRDRLFGATTVGREAQLVAITALALRARALYRMTSERPDPSPSEI